MRDFLKYPYAFLIALSAISTANADTGNEQQVAQEVVFGPKKFMRPPPEPDTTCCEERPVCCPDPRFIYAGVCPYAPFRCNNFWVSADLLVWRACEGLSGQFGDVTITNTVTTTTSTTFVENDKNIDFDWDVGFRVGLGYDFYISGWDMGAYWTRFHQSTKTRDGDNRADWELHFDTVDAVFGRKFWVGCCFDLRPFAGLRYAQIKQELDVDLVTPYTTPTAFTSIATSNEAEQRFWGIGPELGLQADWYFACGFSLYGTLDGGILYGHTKTTYDNSDGDTTTSTICLSTANSCACQAVIDLGLGLRWESRYFTAQAGLEHHRYSDFNQLGCGGALNLFGANFGLGFHY